MLCICSFVVSSQVSLDPLNLVNFRYNCLVEWLQKHDLMWIVHAGVCERLRAYCLGVPHESSRSWARDCEELLTKDSPSARMEKDNWQFHSWRRCDACQFQSHVWLIPGKGRTESWLWWQCNRKSCACWFRFLVDYTVKVIHQMYRGLHIGRETRSAKRNETHSQPLPIWWVWYFPNSPLCRWV